MKVLVAHVTAECNEHISHIAQLDEFMLLYGTDCLKAMHIQEVFEERGIQCIPTVYASLHPNGMIEYSAFESIATYIITEVKEHLSEIDGIYLQLHGASGVQSLEEVSGEHFLIKRIRSIVGDYMPIALVMDPHGNLTKTISDRVNIVRCYRESPHSDQIETEQFVARKLIDLLENRREMKPILKKLSIMVGGERSVSSKEPMLSINALLNEAEKDSRVCSASYHVGYLRHDDDKLGAAVVVVPNTPKDTLYCDEVANTIAVYAWQHRHEFKFSGTVEEATNAVTKAIEYHGKTVVITDSGDNCGAGGYGQNTVLLREVLKTDSKGKKILFAGINDAITHGTLKDIKIGSPVSIDVGVKECELSSAVHIEGTLLHIGEEMFSLTKASIVGVVYTIRIVGTLIDVMVLDRNVQYGNMEQFEKAGLQFHDYDIVIVKMGYLDTYLIPETSFHIMALTDGPTVQRTEKIVFRKIYRPMWPIDDMEELTFIES